jgi:ribosomal protein S18 acetylase RimI-like enzyme
MGARWEARVGVPAVKTATTADQGFAVDTVVLAFAADPIARWCWPEAHQYLAGMPSFTLAFAGAAFTHDTALCTENYAGAALWLPPDVHPDEESLGQIVEQTVSSAIRGDLMTMMEKMGRFHPEEPHWYLPLIGVDPAHQARGYGDALMTHALRQCDREQSAAYLESTNPRNITLYLRHGFEALGQIQVGSSPPMVPMLRRPRR